MALACGPLARDLHGMHTARLPSSLPALLCGLGCVVMFAVPVAFGPALLPGYPPPMRVAPECFRLLGNGGATGDGAARTVALGAQPVSRAVGFAHWFVAHTGRSDDVMWRHIDRDSLEVRWREAVSIRLVRRGDSIAGVVAPFGTATLYQQVFLDKHLVRGSRIACSGAGRITPVAADKVAGRR